MAEKLDKNSLNMQIDLIILNYLQTLNNVLYCSKTTKNKFVQYIQMKKMFLLKIVIFNIDRYVQDICTDKYFYYVL